MEYRGIPDYTMEGIRRYVDHGLEPGDFLTAVFSNDLLGAFGKADCNNVRKLLEICQYIYNEVPAACHGSKEKMKEWMESKRQANQKEE